MTVQRFTAPEDGVLPLQMRQAYQRDGVLLLEDFISQDACNKLKDDIAGLVDGFDLESAKSIFSTSARSHAADTFFRESGDKVRFFFEEGAFDDSGELTAARDRVLNKIGHAMHDLVDEFDAFSRTDRLAAVANSIGLGDPGIVQSMVIFKQPSIGGEVGMHQDGSFLHTDPISVTGFWFALEDADRSNGCLYAVPGGHLDGLKERFHYQDEELVMTAMADKSWPQEAQALEARAGTLVVLHGLLPHYSCANTSQRSRQAYVFHAIDQSAQWSTDNWLRRSNDLPLRGFTG